VYSLMRMNNTVYSLDESSQLLKALADPVRLRILHLLSEAERICVCHIGEALQLPQPTVSRHLAYLRKRGLVTASRAGLWVHYALAKAETRFRHGVMACVQASLASLEELHRDRQRLEEVVARSNGP
jgi:ArsR family transcriptional regulator, arsenate/arsenite/antimonite-responsive transcriptional repressor